MLELRRQNHIHENHGQTERDEKILERLHQLFRPTGENDLILRRKVHFLEDVFDVLHRVGERISGCEVADKGDFPLALETVDLIRAARLFQFHKIRELHQRRFGSVGVG